MALNHITVNEFATEWNLTLLINRTTDAIVSILVSDADQTYKKFLTLTYYNITGAIQPSNEKASPL